MDLKIETTADGSPTLYRPDIDEHYHSIKGALIESSHVYVDLCWRKAAERFNPINLFEVGFGTGLNAALTARPALEMKIPTEYYSVDLHPLPEATINCLLPYLDPAYRREFRAVNDACWNQRVEINPYFTLIKIQGDLTGITIPEGIDAAYFDAFAPDKQPEMWTEEIFAKVFDSMSPQGLLTTYCAKGAIRRLLQQTGFLTERLPGPPGGKREVLRATKP